MTLSEKPGDFRYSLLDTKCATPGHYAVLYYKTPGFIPSPGTANGCELKSNTTYYLNIRNENTSLGDIRHANTRGQDTCPVGITCGFVGVLY